MNPGGSVFLGSVYSTLEFRTGGFARDVSTAQRQLRNIDKQFASAVSTNVKYADSLNSGVSDAFSELARSGNLALGGISTGLKKATDDTRLAREGFAALATSSLAQLSPLSQLFKVALVGSVEGFKSLVIGTASQARKTLGELGSAMATSARQAGELATSAARIGFTAVKVGAVSAMAAIVALGVKGVNSAKDLQALQISMNGLTKSAKLGAKAMAGAFEFAQRSPFQLPDVAAATKTLIAYGQTAETAVGNLESLGNVSITTGVPIAHLASIFGRVSSQGKLMLGDIRQLTDNGVAILPALQRQLGTTAERVQEMAEDGEIGFEQFRNAMVSLVDPSILAQLENTLPRQIDRLGGSVRILSNAFVGVSVDAKNGFQAMADGAYQATVNATRAVANLLRDPAVTAAAAEMGKTVAIGLNAIPAFITAHKADIDQFFNGVAAFFRDINETANKQGVGAAFGKIGEGIRGAVEGIDFTSLATRAIQGLSNSLGSLDWSAHSENMGKAIVGMLNALASNITSVVSAATPALVKISLGIIDGLVDGLLQWLINDPKDFALTVIEAALTLFFAPAKWVARLGGALSKIPIVGPIADFLITEMKKAADNILTPVWDKLKEMGGKVFGGLISGIKSKATDLWSGIAEVAGNIGRFFSGAGNWLWDTGRSLIQGLLNGAGSLLSTIGKFFLDKVPGWIKEPFKKALGIHSPSTLFAGYGVNVVEGLAKGIAGSHSLIRSAMNDLDSQLTVSANHPKFNLPDQSRLFAANGEGQASDASGGRGVVIHQSNTILNQVDLAMANERLGWEMSNA